MIDLSALSAARTPFAVAPLTVTLAAGTHALLGRAEDGVSALLAIVAGRAPARSSRSRVAGHPLGSSAARASIAYVPRAVPLPEALRVDEIFRVADAIRGATGATAAQRLEQAGIGHLARRAARTLSPEEARAVTLTEALTSSATILLFDEPLVGVEPLALARIREMIRARGRSGACVVAATASVHDATDLADDVLIFDRGVLVRRSGAADTIALGVPTAARVRVLCTDPRALVAALAAEPAARGIEADTEGAVVASGATLREVAAAVARAAVMAKTDVQSLAPEAASLEEVRAAASGEAAAAYRVAYDRARAAAMAQQQQQQQQQRASTPIFPRGPQA